MEKFPERNRWWDWYSVFLLLLLLHTLAARLVITSWTPYLHLTQSIASIGVVIGLAAGYSNFRRRTARWLSFFYMILMLPLLWTLVIDQDVSLEEQFASVGGRLLFSFTEFVSRRPVEDPLFFVSIMTILFWVISASAGFQLTRRQNFLAVILPSAIGILIIQNYDSRVPSRLWLLAFFALMALFLLGRLNFLADRKRWREKRIFLSPENSTDLTGSIAIAAGLIIFTAWTIPFTISRIDSARQAWNRVTRPWHDFTRKMQNAVSALESPSGGKPGEFFGSELALGRGFPLSDTIMFEVKVPDLAPADKPPRYYWRGRIYDRYDDGQWSTSASSREEFSPLDADPIVPDSEGRTPQNFVIKTGESRFSLLYGPSQPVWFSRPRAFTFSPAGEARDIITWNSSPALLPGETYQVLSILNNPNIRQLRGAGTDYPEWVTNRYLQLPEGFSPRIRELAANVTSEEASPYDKAVAVTRYLRETIKYSPTVPLPPRRADPLEWILFEHRQAYCVYYATAEVLMLRSLGIPARMAVGFTQGSGSTDLRDVNEEEILGQERYTVRKKNAHAWPEVYFPGIGWVEFEPTGNQTPLDRPAAPQISTDNNFGLPLRRQPLGEGEQILPEDQPNGANSPDQQQAGINRFVYVILLLILLSAPAIYLSRRHAIPARIPGFIRASIERSGAKPPNWLIRWEYWMTLSPIEKAFQSINFGLRRLDGSTPTHATPVERADRLMEILPYLAPQIKVLLDEHQTSLYTSRTADVTQARRAALNIRTQTLLARVRRFWTGTYEPNT